MKLTLDANLFISRYRNEDAAHAAAQAFFDRCELIGVQFFVPTLLLAEVAGALSRIHGETRFGDVAITRIFAEPRLKFRDIDSAFAERAARLAARHSLKGADATYLNVALETRSTLVTNDAELLQAQSQARVITPGAWLASHR